MELPTKRVKEGVSCCALLSLESLLKKLQSTLQGDDLEVMNSILRDFAL